MICSLSVVFAQPASQVAAPELQLSAVKKRSLSNGCSVSTRGIPTCGALVGGSYGLNSDVAPWEKVLGGHLGVHRSFYSAKQVSNAVSMAKKDLSIGRLPWISFKPPYSWSQMASGKGDAWAKDLAAKFSKVSGPVWVAVAHEPETDGDMLVWKRMQERLGPILRNNAGNLGFSVILMGYHEFFGRTSTYDMSRIWPNTKVDMAGFDVYNHYGKNGQKKHTDMKAYFTKISTWAKSRGVDWGLAETGISNAGAAAYPNWFADTYTELKNQGGKAFSYFNSSANSFQDWSLSTSLKRDRFKAIFKSSPSL